MGATLPLPLPLLLMLLLMVVVAQDAGGACECPVEPRGLLPPTGR